MALIALSNKPVAKVTFSLSVPASSDRIIDHEAKTLDDAQVLREVMSRTSAGGH